MKLLNTASECQDPSRGRWYIFDNYRLKLDVIRVVVRVFCSVYSQKRCSLTRVVHLGVLLVEWIIIPISPEAFLLNQRQEVTGCVCDIFYVTPKNLNVVQFVVTCIDKANFFMF